MMALAVVGSIVSICAIACCRQDKKVPHNYIWLGVFTLSEAWLIATICTKTDPKIVLEAAVLTLGDVVAITIYAMTTKTDFTVCGPALFIFGMTFSIVGFFLAIFGFHLGIVWAGIGVILFSFYLLFDTQMIMGGDSKRYQFDEDSYILAAVALYLDIVNIFLYILQMLGDK